MNGQSEWRKTLRRWSYTLFTAPRGVGRPEASATWDEQYRSGHWDRLDSAAQLPHYAIISGYVSHFFPKEAHILDVGCGHGRLYQLLSPLSFERYLGLDLSEEAIAKASLLATPRAQFEVADFEKWTSSSRFDVIIFNESIYYAQNPTQELSRYEAMLNEQGLLILSMVQGSLNWGVARKIRRRFQRLHSACVRNEEGETWEVQLLRRSAGQDPA